MDGYHVPASQKIAMRNCYVPAFLLLFCFNPIFANDSGAPPIKLATFDIDATPPIGFAMAYDRVRRVEELGLRCRGIVLIGKNEPVVLCAIDWIGIANGGHDAFRDAIAKAAGTTRQRVAMHALHQHDAPRCDFSAEQLLHEAGVSDVGALNSSLARDVLNRLKQAIAASIETATTVTHVGYGTAEVEGVASNRRLLDESGKVFATRYTTCKDPKLRAFPEGTIDPVLTSISFWTDKTPLAVLTYYACHPQSYYRTGIPSPDFPGIARFIRGQDVPDVLHVHFNGAGGNIGAGKFNDGSKENRLKLALRVAAGMKSALESSAKESVDADDLDWSVVPVALPPAKHIDGPRIHENLKNYNQQGYADSPEALAWLMRCQAGHQIDLACLKIGDIRVLHMPGELFVEYQLAAKSMRPDLKVAMAAYGDYGPGYIGTEISYSQGGYETSQRASKVDKSCERVLMDGMKVLLEVGE